MKRPRRIAVGRYARVTNAARIDVVGRVVRHTDVGIVVLVPYWMADGQDHEWYAADGNYERSTKADSDTWAKKRGQQ
jgi:hypothetical protein